MIGRIGVLIVVACLLGCVATVAFADLHCDFEVGLGHNAEPIGSEIPGLVFSTTSGGDVCYADINSGWYSARSDNGKVYEDGEYFVSGDVAGFISDLNDKAKVSFACGTASYLTVGYSSLFGLTVEAYDSSNNLLDSKTGPANTKSKGGTGLTYLTVSHSDIAYVLLHDSGSYWMIDNIDTDAPVPEPSSIFTLLSGTALIIIRRRSPRRNHADKETAAGCEVVGEVDG